MTPILASWPVQGLPDFKWKGSAVQKCAKVVTRERGNLLRAGHRGTMYVVPSSPQRPSMLPFSPPIVLQCAQRAILSGNKWRLARVTPSPATVTVSPRHPQVRNVNHQSWVSPNKNSPVLQQNGTQRRPLPGLPRGLLRWCGSGFNWRCRPRGGPRVPPCSTHM